MKTFNKTLIAAATIATFGLAAAPSALSIEASATLATSYLWRGAEQGTGDAALAVDLSGETLGINYGLWLSSGAGQTEHDYYASYSGEVAGVGYELGLIDYNYQPVNGVNAADMEETYVTLSYGPVSISQFENSDNFDDYTVVTYDAGSFSVSYGEITTGNGADNDTNHTDVNYNVTDALTLTLSDSSIDNTDLVFVASYSLPF
jgi:hypothetical protein